MYAAHIRARQNERRIHTTLGELIATISDVAFEHAANTDEAYEITRLVLVKILKDAWPTRKVVERRFPTSYVH